MAEAVPRKRTPLIALMAVTAGVLALAFMLTNGTGPQSAGASSHREAPLISEDPAADNTDVYAFRSPDKPDTVTIMANYIPLEEPAGGPNFNAFGDDVLYKINVDNTADGEEDIVYEFRFRTETRNRDTFLYNTGPIDTLSDPDWNDRSSTASDQVETETGGRTSARTCRRLPSTSALARRRRTPR